MSRSYRKRESGATMKLRLIMVAPALALATTARAQTPLPSAEYSRAYQAYRFVAPTPWDAYKQGIINRWELEQLQGPIPQALQGPSPEGRGASGGGSGG